MHTVVGIQLAQPFKKRKQPAQALPRHARWSRRAARQPSCWGAHKEVGVVERQKGLRSFRRNQDPAHCNQNAAECQAGQRRRHSQPNVFGAAPQRLPSVRYTTRQLPTQPCYLWCPQQSVYCTHLLLHTTASQAGLFVDKLCVSRSAQA